MCLLPSHHWEGAIQGKAKARLSVMQGTESGSLLPDLRMVLSLQQFNASVIILMGNEWENMGKFKRKYPQRSS